MVRHTHQDFLHRLSNDTESLDINHFSVCFRDLESVKEHSEPPCLFDTPGDFFRKVSISYLDEYIDDKEDWDSFVKPLAGIDCLYLIDDRDVTNPIMKRYAQFKNQQYLRQLQEDGICGKLVQTR